MKNVCWFLGRRDVRNVMVLQSGLFRDLGDQHSGDVRVDGGCVNRMKKRVFRVVIYDDEDTDTHYIKEVLSKYEIYDADITLESEEDAEVTVCPECGFKTPVGRSRRCPIGMCSIAAAEWEETKKERGW